MSRHSFRPPIRVPRRSATPRLTVDFYLYTSHEVPTWKPIIDALRRRGVDARFVLEPPGRNVARGSSSSLGTGWRNSARREDLVHLVDERTFTMLSTCLAEIGEAPLSRRRRTADVAVTTSGVRWLRMWSGARVRTLYGVGLVADAFGHGSVNQGFDLVLSPGPFSTDEIQRMCPQARVEAVGYPKWSERRPTREASPRPIRTILWLPTWAEHSSLDRYSQGLSELADGYRVRMKPHHNSARFETERMAGFCAPGSPTLEVAEPTALLADLIEDSDVVVSDARSGALTEAILGRRPVVAVVDPASAEVPHPVLAQVAYLCRDPSQLRAAVAEAARLGRRPGAEGAVEYLFGPDDGHDALRAADAIVRVAGSVGRPVRRRLAALMWTALYRTARRLGR